jgi:hypothetical protein
MWTDDMQSAGDFPRASQVEVGENERNDGVAEPSLRIGAMNMDVGSSLGREEKDQTCFSHLQSSVCTVRELAFWLRYVSCVRELPHRFALR